MESLISPSPADQRIACQKLREVASCLVKHPQQSHFRLVRDLLYPRDGKPPGIWTVIANVEHRQVLELRRRGENNIPRPCRS